MRNNILYKCVCICSISLLIYSCQKEKAADPLLKFKVDCDSLDVSFLSDIQPIFSASCAVIDCHNSVTAESGIILETYAQISNELLNGSVECVIKHNSGCTPMPFNLDKLNDTLIQKIECWKTDGAPNN